MPVFSESSSGTIPNCEYLVHKSHIVIHSLFTLELTAERHFCSIFKHKSFGQALSARFISRSFEVRARVLASLWEVDPEVKSDTKTHRTPKALCAKGSAPQAPRRGLIIRFAFYPSDSQPPDKDKRRQRRRS
jgi:hypothetical protein